MSLFNKKEKDKELCEYIETFVENSKMKMQPFIVVGELNREYIRGNQHRKINPKTHSVVDKQKPKGIYMERKKFNRMLPIYLTRQGIMTDNQPIVGFQPSVGDPRSINGAITGNAFLKELRKQIKIKKIYGKRVKQADLFPLAFAKIGTDYSQGDVLFDGEITVEDTEGNKEKKQVTVHEGRHFVEVLPIYECFPDAIQVESFEEVNEFVHRRPLSVKAIERRYGVVIDPEPIDQNYVQRGYYVQSVTEDYENHAYVSEYYQRPCAEFPKGRYIIKLGGEYIYHKGPLPYINGEYGTRTLPFVCDSLQSVPGFLPGITVYSQIIDIQDTYNALKNRILEYFNRLAIGRKFAWKGSLVNPNGWTNKPGGVTWLTRHGRPPQNEQIDKIGGEFANYLSILSNDMLEIAGLSALQALGKAASNMRAEGIVDKIAESDTNKLSDAIKSLSETELEIFRQILYLEKERQRILKEEFKLDNLDEFTIKYNLKDVDPEEIVVVNREFLMQSDQIVEKKMLQANQLGLYNPQAGLSFRTKMETLDMLQAGYLKETLDPVERANWSRIKREHFMILNRDESVKVEDFDLHPMHIMEHQLELMSDTMEELKRTDADLFTYVDTKLREHIDQHKELSQQSQRQRDLAVSAKGAFE